MFYTSIASGLDLGAHLKTYFLYTHAQDPVKSFASGRPPGWPAVAADSSWTTGTASLPHSLSNGFQAPPYLGSAKAVTFLGAVVLPRHTLLIGIQQEMGLNEVYK